MALRVVLHATDSLTLVTHPAVPTEWKAMWAPEKLWIFRTRFTLWRRNYFFQFQHTLYIKC